MIHWVSLALAVAAGGWTAVNEPTQRLFERSARALGLSGPGVQLLDMAYSMAEVFVALLIAYAVTRLVLDAVSERVF